MRCFRRSTRLFASVLIVSWLSAAQLESAGGAQDNGGPGPVQPAIEASVKSRMGGAAAVSVALVSGMRLVGSTPVVAIPDPSARIGRPSHFVLVDGTPGKPPVRVGEATVTVDVVADVVRTRRSVDRGSELGSDDVEVVRTSLAGRAIRPLPALEETVGAKTTRDLRRDAVVSRADIVPRLLVRAGDTVRARLQMAEIELTGSVVAAENGRRNEIIRVVNQESRHVLRARVVGHGEVEVVHVR